MAGHEPITHLSGESDFTFVSLFVNILRTKADRISWSTGSDHLVMFECRCPLFNIGTDTVSIVNIRPVNHIIRKTCRSMHDQERVSNRQLNIMSFGRDSVYPGIYVRNNPEEDSNWGPLSQQSAPTFGTFPKFHSLRGQEKL